MVTDKDWQSMETAPKDRPFYACSPRREVFVLEWNPGFQGFMIHRKKMRPYYEPTLWAEYLYPKAPWTWPLPTEENASEEA
jgi:hypothetical protein